MSRLQGHRKSQSTSALNVIADGGFPSTPGGMEKRREKRASQHPSLGPVSEMTHPPSLPPTPSHRSREMRYNENKSTTGKCESRRFDMDEVKGWMTDVSSLRSSDRRRNVALRNIEKLMVRSCLPSKSSSETGLPLETLITLELHRPLLTLLTRHAQALSSRHPPREEELVLVVLELGCAVGLLQGLCLLSRKSKEAVGEQHVLEILIDLLLLLRTQPPPPTLNNGTESHSIVYLILELLCCVLVDSPENSRTFERLSGLEATVRVLKGTGVAKEIRMKCVEFLYFYLQPEDAKNEIRTVSSSSARSASSSSSGESLLYPPSPLSASTSSIGPGGRISPSPLPSSASARRFEDLDMPFIPQTPQKKPQPSLGYLTPSNRRVSGGSVIASTTPSLEPVPASPDESASVSVISKTPSDRDKRKEERDARRWSVMENVQPSNAGLGLGLPKSSSMSSNLSLAATPSTRAQRDVTAIRVNDKLVPSDSFSDPFSDTRSSSSGSSTVVPSRDTTGAGMTRSSTTTDMSSNSIASNLPPRRSSIRRPSRPQGVPIVAPIQETPQSRQPKPRHSRTQSALVNLPPPPMPVPALPSTIESRRKSTPPSTTSTSSGSRSTMAPPPPMPTPAKRAFPAELTRGIPPSASSPALGRPLGATRRVPSVKSSIEALGQKQDKKGVKSYEQKKELLSNWLGNVDALVQGVEKVSFWGNKKDEGGGK